VFLDIVFQKNTIVSKVLYHVKESYVKPTPKYHCKLAGEGIVEYSWRFAKLRYWRVPLEGKNSAMKKIRACVAEALDAI